MKNVMRKIAKVTLQIVIFFVVLISIMFATAVYPGSEESLAPALMEQYNVDSLEELINYGHEKNN